MALVAWRTGTWKLQIVKRSDVAGFEVLPKRWIVERTFAWISRNRRLARDFERYATTVTAFIRLAMIRIMLRRSGIKLCELLKINWIYRPREKPLCVPKIKFCNICGEAYRETAGQ